MWDRSSSQHIRAAERRRAAFLRQGVTLKQASLRLLDESLRLIQLSNDIRAVPKRPTFRW